MSVDYETFQKIQKLGDNVFMGIAEVAALTGFSVLTVRQRELPGLGPIHGLSRLRWRPQDLDAYRGYKYPASATKKGCAFKAEAHGPAYEKKAPALGWSIAWRHSPVSTGRYLHAKHTRMQKREELEHHEVPRQIAAHRSTHARSSKHSVSYKTQRKIGFFVSDHAYRACLHPCSPALQAMTAPSRTCASRPCRVALHTALTSACNDAWSMLLSLPTPNSRWLSMRIST